MNNYFAPGLGIWKWRSYWSHLHVLPPFERSYAPAEGVSAGYYWWVDHGQQWVQPQPPQVEHVTLFGNNRVSGKMPATKRELEAFAQVQS